MTLLLMVALELMLTSKKLYSEHLIVAAIERLSFFLPLSYLLGTHALSYSYFTGLITLAVIVELVILAAIFILEGIFF